MCISFGERSGAEERVKSFPLQEGEREEKRRWRRENFISLSV
jgi:hypothetical protein